MCSIYERDKYCNLFFEHCIIVKMDSFYWIILSVATLILIGTLAYMGYLMSQVKKITKYPLITTTCPDNWLVDDTKGCQIPTGYNAPSDTRYKDGTNTPGLDSTSVPQYINFNHPGWSSKGDATCAKKTWAAKYGVKWDSVENANYC